MVRALGSALLVLALSSTGALAEEPARERGPDRPLDFARDVRPILSDNCFTCHGPDEGQRMAGLRLDTPDGPRAGLRGGGAAVVPLDLEASELWHRILSDDPGTVMPPPETGKVLEPAERQVLRRWIEEGAQWSQHWAFEPPVAPELPEVEREGWARQTLDFFVLERLEQEGLEPQPEADRATLARRASLALTGLPLSPEQLDAFLADMREDAYERLVDELLASPSYGEHMARYWLDAARYADTHGLHLDNRRSMWPWRDHVVRVLNENQPFDQFTLEMLAGDLLPDATPAQVIASGFNRNNPSSAEGGMIQAEYRTIYAKDRTDTTSTIWMGLTAGCAKCHDHKYDPLSAREYYSLYAFFDDLGDEATDRNIDNPIPFVAAPTAEQRAELERMEAELAAGRAKLEEPIPGVDEAEARWQEELLASLRRRWLLLTPEEVEAQGGTEYTLREDLALEASGPNPDKEVVTVTAFTGEDAVTGLRLEALLAGSSDRLPGRATNQNFVLSTVRVEAWPAGAPEQAQPVELAGAVASFSQDKYPIAAVLDDDVSTGWAGLGREGDRQAAFLFAQPVGWPQGTVLRVTLAFESVHVAHTFSAFRLAVTGDPAFTPPRAEAWSLAGPTRKGDPRAAFAGLTPDDAPGPERFADLEGAPDGAIFMLPSEPGVFWLRRLVRVPVATRLTARLGSDDAVKVWVNGELAHENPAARAVRLDQDTAELPLRAGVNEVLMAVVNYGGAAGFAFRLEAGRDSLDATDERPGLPFDLSLALDGGELTPEQQRRLRVRFRRQSAPQWVALFEEVEALQQRRDAHEAAFPTTLVSREAAMNARQAHVLLRGQYDQLGEPVEPDVPAVLPPMDPDLPRDRLGLARWLTDPRHPLTARVTVNRHWLRFFGTGLVKTAEDFGVQGEWPSHKDLLDHLATEFVADGWDVKGLHRRLVTSATFRQAARMDAALLERDPYNRLLTRGPRFRLDGEVLRDQALALAGLLVDRIGGPPVRPYQPDGIWFAVGYSRSNTVRFRQDQGDANWRRSLYTFWKRTAPPPNLATFDAPTREACAVRRERTNTPMQALVLLNDRQFVEMARAFASRILREGGATDEERAAWAFRAATARRPEATELAELTGLLADARAHFGEDPEGAAELRAVGDAPVDAELDPVEHAAHTLLANLILNLDETVTLH